MATWTYLLAYNSAGGIGNAVIDRPRPIDSAEEVEDVQAWLRNEVVQGALLINVVLLKHTSERGAVTSDPTPERGAAAAAEIQPASRPTPRLGGA